jgi:hypothetical protein
MTAAKNRVSRTTRRLRPVGPDFVDLGKRGKRALGARVLALRTSGPVHVLKWINEDIILRQSFDGLEELGAKHVVRVLGRGRTLLSETTWTTTVRTLDRNLMAQLRVVGAGEALRNIAETILDALAVAPVAWCARIRRCAYEDCDRPYFWDATDAGVRKHCSDRHKKAAIRQRQ